MLLLILHSPCSTHSGLLTPLHAPSQHRTLSIVCCLQTASQVVQLLLLALPEHHCCCQGELRQLQPVLEKTAVDVEAMMVRITADKKEAAVTQKAVAQQEQDANEQAAKVWSVHVCVHIPSLIFSATAFCRLNWVKTTIAASVHFACCCDAKSCVTLDIC